MSPSQFNNKNKAVVELSENENFQEIMQNIPEDRYVRMRKQTHRINESYSKSYK
jgi:hypothetical protein